MYMKHEIKILKPKYVKPVFIAAEGDGGNCGCQGSY